MKRSMNLALKTAILSSRRTQKRVAALARIKESRLSRIVHNEDHPATNEERQRLAAVLDKSQDELFPESVEAVAS